MALETSILNDILTEMVKSFKTVYLVSEAQTAIILGNDITGLTAVSNPEPIDLVWGGASGGSLTTTNSPDDGNAINFSVKKNLRGKTLVFREPSGSTITGSIDLTVDAIAGSKGSGTFIGEIPISLTEV